MSFLKKPKVEPIIQRDRESEDLAKAAERGRALARSTRSQTLMGSLMRPPPAGPQAGVALKTVTGG